MKEDRQRAILDLVRQRAVHTQQELANALAERGFSATQATVSRDIQELGLLRNGDRYVVGRPAILSELVLSIQQVQFLVVVRTPSGTANLVARAIDEAGPDGIAGTVAGDDTIIVVLGDEAAADDLRRFLGADW
ncbi:MAG TPA: arginine repressor [Candidatus Dormibacteraeota bacterium]